MDRTVPPRGIDPGLQEIVDEEVPLSVIDEEDLTEVDDEEVPLAPLPALAPLVSPVASVLTAVGVTAGTLAGLGGAAAGKGWRALAGGKTSTQQILFPVDGLRTDVMETAVLQFAEYLKKNDNARIHLFTRDGSYERESELLNQVSKILEQGGYPAEWARKNDAEKKESEPILFVVEQCVEDSSVDKCVQEQRLMVDLADTPDQLLQKLCVNIGIPQIANKATQYIVHGENGQVAPDILKMVENLAYYLENPENWDHAVECSHKLSRKLGGARPADSAAVPQEDPDLTDGLMDAAREDFPLSMIDMEQNQTK